MRRYYGYTDTLDEELDDIYSKKRKIKVEVFELNVKKKEVRKDEKITKRN